MRLARLVAALVMLLSAPAEGYRLLPGDAPALAPLMNGHWRLTTRAGSIVVVFGRRDELPSGRPVLIGRRKRSGYEDVVAMPLDGGGVLMLVTSPAHCERYVFPELGRRQARGTLTLYEADCEAALVVGSLRVRARRH